MRNAAAEALVAPGPSRGEWTLWGGAGLAVLLLHAAFVYALQAMRPLGEPPMATEQALTIELSPLPVSAPDSVETEAVEAEGPAGRAEPVPEPDRAPAVAAENAQEVTPDAAGQVVPEQAPDPSGATPVNAIDAEQPVAVQPDRAEAVEPETDPVATAQVEQPLPAEPEKTLPVEPDLPSAEAVPAIQAETALPPPPRPAPARPAGKPVAKPTPARKPAAKPARAAPPRAVPRSAAPRSAASQRAVASRGPTISPAQWQSRVLAWVNRHKRYPAGARSRGEEGSVGVAFSINAGGTVVSARVSRSSGNPELDRAALDMVRRSSPVPAPPSGMPGRLDLSLPVQFRLN